MPTDRCRGRSTKPWQPLKLNLKSMHFEPGEIKTSSRRHWHLRTKGFEGSMKH
jgi:hypothetical protein